MNQQPPSAETQTAFAANMPYAFLFGLVVVLLVRSGELRLWIAIVSGLFGFYLALSGAGPLIDGMTHWVVGGLTHSESK